MNQHEITERRPLLDASGNLTEPGYAKSLLPVYRRGDIKANKLRIKEWDYYCINNGHFALALTIADNSYMGLDSISLLNLDEGWEITKSPMKAFTNGKVCLPESSERGDVHSAGRNYSILFKNEGDRRVLIAQMKNFGPEGSLYAKVTLTDIPAESMVIATPFDKDKHFYYNQKINCMRAEGTVTYGYHNRTYTFDAAEGGVGRDQQQSSARGPTNERQHHQQAHRQSGRRGRVFPEPPGACHVAGQQRHGARGIGHHGRYTGKDQGGQCQKAAASGDGIEGASHEGGHEQQGGFQHVSLSMAHRRRIIVAILGGDQWVFWIDCRQKRWDCFAADDPGAWRYLAYGSAKPSSCRMAVS